MGTALTNTQIKNTYLDVCQLGNSGAGITSSPLAICDGSGTASALQISTLGVAIVTVGGLTLGAAAVAGNIKATDATSGAGNDLTITGSNAGSGNTNGGDIVLTPGTKSGAGAAGRIKLTGQLYNKNTGASGYPIYLERAQDGNATFSVLDEGSGHGTVQIGVNLGTLTTTNGPIVITPGGGQGITLSTLTTLSSGLTPAHMTDGAASNDTIYYSTTANKLVYKDSGGVVNNLY